MQEIEKWRLALQQSSFFVLTYVRVGIKEVCCAATKW